MTAARRSVARDPRPGALDWDYTAAARAYLQRPAYAPAAIDEILHLAGLSGGARVADVGAGTGNLTVPLLERGLHVIAIEPNDAMRALGRQRTAAAPAARWISAVAASTGLASQSCAAVGFGSSFNVVDTVAAVAESARITGSGGSLFCLWNHRCLGDPLQSGIERIIRRHVPDFVHGARRSDPTTALRDGSCFDAVRAIEATVRHRIPRAEFLEAWHSHLTLRRQAGPAFPAVIAAIAALLDRADPVLDVPYVTRAWVARKIAH